MMARPLGDWREENLNAVQTFCPGKEPGSLGASRPGPGEGDLPAHSRARPLYLALRRGGAGGPQLTPGRQRGSVWQP